MNHGENYFIRMNKSLYFSTLLLILLTGCQKDYVDNDIPEPIKNRIDASMKQSLLCSDATVNEWAFQNIRVYGFSSGSCMSEPTASVYDANGNLLCSLGGFSGNTSCNGEPFSKATFLRTIWKNK